ncbi:hypothetical protein EYF80_040373 [Liparis tanakae]|uniref:Uncharacterized protein n=1 Tax=Liparis tanakae TaxID=230148 RepID=A0A4Z2G7A6_9TELE|nr:hypothetical protein EYF80_040373 [Liparis tanakae]
MRSHRYWVESGACSATENMERNSTGSTDTGNRHLDGGRNEPVVGTAATSDSSLLIRDPVVPPSVDGALSSSSSSSGRIAAVSRSSMFGEPGPGTLLLSERYLRCSATRAAYNRRRTSNVI